MRRILIYSILCISLLSTLLFTVYAYWLEPDLRLDHTLNSGQWNYGNLNLNIWETNDTLNQTVPHNTVFMYNNLLYVVRDGMDYNPQYHGLPGSGSNQWAYVSLELEWMPNMNYRATSVVIRDDRYFYANPHYHGANTDWFINDPLTHSGNNTWFEWREIEPVDINMFNINETLGIIDYRLEENQVIYK